jgi:hypothetical protein
MPLPSCLLVPTAWFSVRAAMFSHIDVVLFNNGGLDGLLAFRHASIALARAMPESYFPFFSVV